MLALSIHDLVKTYAGGLQALKGIDLSVEAGDFFALLGPNGAGKSTTIGIVSSLVNKSSGRVSIFGHDLDREREAAKASIGLVPQEFNFNVFEPIENTIINVAGYNGIPRRHARARVEYYLKKLDLWDKRRAPARELSGGMKRRLMIARSLVHEPRLLILDEPTAGVDITIRRSMWEFLQEINQQQGITIILTTHYLEEAEALCRNVAIIDGGQIIERGAVSALLSQAIMQTFVLDVQGVDEDEQGADLPELPGPLPPFNVRARPDGRLEADVPRGASLNDLFGWLTGQGIQITSLRTKSNRLEEFFLRLVEKPAGDAVQGLDIASRAVAEDKAPGAGERVA